MNKTILSTVAILMCATGAALAGETPHWTYSGEAGPARWGSLEPTFAACATGTMQSPIDLAAQGSETAFQIEVAYSKVPLTILNNGHTVQIAAEGAGTMVSDGTTYTLVQVHFHAPSEHVIDGRPAPIEAHFVHKADDGRLAVLGVFVVAGDESPALAALLSHLPETTTPAETFEDVAVDLLALLPRDVSVYRYMGSLTTPPCTEGVAWHVLREPITASREQIGKLALVLHGNARPVQPLNGRPLLVPSF